MAADGKIIAAGTFKELNRSNPHADLVEFSDGILLPPFVNAHTHLELSDFSIWAKVAGEPEPPSDFIDWILWLVRVKRTVSEEQIKKSLVKGLRLSLETGTGMVGDILTTFSAATAYASSPLYGRAYSEVLGHDLTVALARLGEIAKVSTQQNTGRFDIGLSPHSSYTLSKKVMQEVFAFAKQENLQSCIHLAESKEETCFLTDASGPVGDKLYSAAQWDTTSSVVEGRSPVQTLCREGRLKPGDLVVHGVEVDKDDIRQLKDKGCSVVLCPRSNAAFGGGKAPVKDYLSSGVNLALGTDSLASSPSLSIWDELAFAQVWFEGAASPRQWLQIATSGGLKALRPGDHKALFEPGSAASFQVVCWPAALGAVDVEEVLVETASERKVSHLYLDGRNVLPIS